MAEMQAAKFLPVFQDLANAGKSEDRGFYQQPHALKRHKDAIVRLNLCQTTAKSCVSAKNWRTRKLPLYLDDAQFVLRDKTTHAIQSNHVQKTTHCPAFSML
jgi:hypothetical protein